LSEVIVAPQHESTIRDYARILVRRKWVIVLAVVIVPALAVYLSLRQSPLYSASAKVLLKQQNLAATLSGIQDTSVYLDPTRVAQTQIELAETPLVAKRVLKAVHFKHTSPGALLGSVSISSEPNADILDFSVSNRYPALAVQLVNEYAKQYTIYRRQLDTAVLNQALNNVLRRIDQLEASGNRSYANSLVSKAEQLRTFAAVENQNAVLARPADGAGKVRPTPRRYGLVGLALGAMLGIGLAFVWEALDTRVRSAEDITQRLGLPLLARLPAPPRKLQRASGLVMLDAAQGVEAEAFRVLRTNLDFVNLERNARSIMITSAVEAEGKSTTVSNLAVAVARSGRRVLLVDLDLRRPTIDKFFKLGEGPGLTNVVLGDAALEDAIVRVAVPEADAAGKSSTNGHSPVGGFLDVLASGPLPPNAGEFVGTGAVVRLLESLTQRYDLVLIDTPPILQVGDPLTLSQAVDAIILVARLPAIRRPMLRELKRVLDTSPADKLGFALAGAQLEEGYGYAYGYYYAEPRRRAASRERVG
jgi:capsular exopolysaccharide synthesis family protein